jgi:hypothetical protein
VERNVISCKEGFTAINAHLNKEYRKKRARREKIDVLGTGVSFHGKKGDDSWNRTVLEEAFER